MPEKLLKVKILLRKVEVIEACNFQLVKAESSEVEIIICNNNNNNSYCAAATGTLVISIHFIQKFRKPFSLHVNFSY